MAGWLEEQSEKEEKAKKAEEGSREDRRRRGANPSPNEGTLGILSSPDIKNTFMARSLISGGPVTQGGRVLVKTGLKGTFKCRFCDPRGREGEKERTKESERERWRDGNGIRRNKRKQK